MKRFWIKQLTTFTIIAAVPTSTLYAQAATAIEEILVTAQRRTESLQEVPVAITAVTSTDLLRQNINNTSRLEMMTPGLVWGNGGGSRAWPTLRGVETGNGEANGEPSIAFMIDSIYKSRSAQANAPLIDVERVEVLRGPQGTLFGRNSTGGAINVISAKPSTEVVDYYVDLTLGDYSNRKLDAMLNVPLSENWALRVAIRSHHRDGYQENVSSGPDPMDEGMLFFRGSLGYSGENTTAVFRISHMDLDRVGGGAFTSKVLGQSYDPSIPGRSVFGDALFVSPRLNDGIAETNVNGTQTDLGVPIDPDPFRVQINWPISEQLESTELSVDIGIDMGSFTLRSLTGYSDFDSDPIGDNDYFDLSTVRNRTDRLTAVAETFTQEFQIISQGDHNTEWILGLFYLDDSVSEVFSIQNFDANNQVAAVFPSPAGGMTSFVFDRRTETDIQAIAAYGQLKYRLSENFNLSAGVRWSQDDKDYQLREFGFLGGLGFNPDLNLSETFDDPTWRLGFEYFPGEESMLYGSVSTGFRSGGFNRFQDDPTTENNETVFGSEEITAYEIGWKNTFADGRARLNLAAFFQELEDQQVSTVQSVAGTGQSGFFNAGKTDIYGLEAELDLLVNDALRVFSNLTLLNGEYKAFMSSGFDGDPVLVDLAGNTPPRAPDYKGTLGAAYRVDLAGNASLTPSINVQFSDDLFHTHFNTSLDRQDSFARWDARLTYENSDSNWHFEVFAENFTDQDVASYGIFGGSNAYFENYMPPKTLGIRAVYRK